jgi:short-subunit dehydrogenase
LFFCKCISSSSTAVGRADGLLTLFVCCLKRRQCPKICSNSFSPLLIMDKLV